MLAVSNTSPVSNLASIGRLELLKSQFQRSGYPMGLPQNWQRIQTRLRKT